MRAQRDYFPEMSRFPLDDDTATRLLGGHVAPDDAPPGYAGVAGVVRSATGPASRRELAGEAAVVAAAAAAVPSAPNALQTQPRRRPVLAKVLSAKVVVAAASVAFLGAGTAAAAVTGSLPTQATSHASAHAAHGLATAQAHIASGGSTNHHSAPAHGSKSPATPGSIPSTGPANSHALFGLCTAFLAQSHASTTTTTASPSTSSTAFKALIAETGGSAAATTTYCTAYVAAHHPGTTPGTTNGSTAPDDTAKPSGTGTPTTAGKPADVGKPANPGPPATAGESSQHAPVVTPNLGSASTSGSVGVGVRVSGTVTAGNASAGASSAGSANATMHTSH